MCKYCNVRLEGEKLDTLKKHTTSVTHLRKKSNADPQPGSSGIKRQSTIVGAFEVQKRAKTEKEEFLHGKIYVSGSGNLPSGDNLRRKYVPQCGVSEKDEVKQKLKDQPVVVVADETSDKQGRCVFAVLLKTVSSEPQQSCFLASVNFLDTANASTCSQVIIDTLKEYEIQYSQVHGLVSDSTSVNVKYHLENSIDLSMMFKTAAQKSLDKLLVHMGPNPTNECYKHIGRLFCPSEAANVPSSSVNSNSIVESFAKIPFSTRKLIDGYFHFHRQLLRLVGQEAPVDVMQVLASKASKSCYPGFAKAAIQCLNWPVNSVDAERYFSVYNIVKM
ncbi:hypothetical protein ACJJTC_004505 [Scirpophaga incertulas]